MKSIFLYTKQQLPLTMQKISQCLYYDTKTDNFYRLNVMPPCTVFASEDVEERQMMTLTKYDPCFLMIERLYSEKKIDLAELPHYLQKRNWGLISTEEQQNGRVFYVFNREKVYSFLEKKVELMERYIDQHNPLDRLKLLKLDNVKTISSDVIALLKNEINADLVVHFVKEVYNSTQSRKQPPQSEEKQVFKPKPMGKNAKKPAQTKQQDIPKSQKTLFGFLGSVKK